MLHELPAADLVLHQQAQTGGVSECACSSDTFLAYYSSSCDFKRVEPHVCPMPEGEEGEGWGVGGKVDCYEVIMIGM